MELVYRVEQSVPAPKALGHLRVTLGSGLTRYVREQSASKELMLYTKSYCLLREKFARSDLAEIRPQRTSGRLANFPLFPPSVFGNGTPGPEFVRRPLPSDPAQAAFVANPAAVVYGWPLYYSRADESTLEFLKQRLPASYRVSRANVVTDIWTYSDYRYHPGSIFPAKIEHQLFDSRAPGKIGLETTWTLERVDRVPSTVLSEEQFLGPTVTVQDNREMESPVAFRYDPKAGSLEAQSARARVRDAARTRRVTVLGMAPLLPILTAAVGVVAIVVCGVALRIRPIGKS